MGNNTKKLKNRVNADISVDSAHPVRHITPKRKKIVLIAIAAFVVSMLILGFVVYRASYKASAPGVITADARVKQVQATQRASNLSLRGKSSEAQTLLDKQINVGSPEDQSNIYAQKAMLAVQAKDYVSALKFAKKAESLKQTAYSAQAVAMSAEGSGDKALALEYYKKQLNRVGFSHVANGNADIEAKIKALSN